MTNKAARDVNLQTTDLPHRPVELADKELEGVTGGFIEPILGLFGIRA
jgi:hypothetical protein